MPKWTVTYTWQVPASGTVEVEARDEAEARTIVREAIARNTPLPGAEADDPPIAEDMIVQVHENVCGSEPDVMTGSFWDDYGNLEAFDVEAIPEPITVLQVALARLGRPADSTEPLTGEDFAKVGLPLFGGCQGCEASIAAYNACPSKTGFLRCKDCIDDLGFATVKEFEAYNREVLNAGDEDDTDPE